IQVPAPSLERVPGEEPLDQLELSGYDVQGKPGEPALPSRSLLVAVPPLGDVRLTAVAGETIGREEGKPAPTPAFDPHGHAGVGPRSAAAYAAPGSGTPVAARLVGVTWMRNQRVARVLVEPAAYEPSARRLTVAGRIDVELAVTPAGALGPLAETNDPFESVYRLTLVNYEQGRAWRRPRADALARAARRPGVPPAAHAAPA